MEKVVRIKKNGQVLVEIPLSLYPVEIEMSAVKDDGQWYEKSYTWLLSYWRDETGLKKFFDKPKGMQVS